MQRRWFVAVALTWILGGSASSAEAYCSSITNWGGVSGITAYGGTDIWFDPYVGEGCETLEDPYSIYTLTYENIETTLHTPVGNQFVSTGYWSSPWGGGSYPVETSMAWDGYGPYQVHGGADERICVYYGLCDSVTMIPGVYYINVPPPEIQLQTSAYSVAQFSNPVQISAQINPSAYPTWATWGGCSEVSFTACSLDTSTPGVHYITLSALLVNVWKEAAISIEVIEQQSPPPQPSTVTLSANRPQELNKPTHFVALKDSGNVVVQADLQPQGTSPSVIVWGGDGVTNGGDASQRIISTSQAGNFTVTATAPGNAATISVHVVDATALPAAQSLPQVLQQPIRTTATTLPAACVGDNACVIFKVLPSEGVAAPEWEVTAHLSDARWRFRVTRIQHTYKYFVPAASDYGRTDVPAAVNPFPTHPSFATQWRAKCQAAMIDMNPTGSNPQNSYCGPGQPAPPAVVPYGSLLAAPPLQYFWARHITEAHEDAHVTRFYDSPGFWPLEMGKFKDEIEDETAWADFNCENPNTAARPAVETAIKGIWAARMEELHMTAAANDAAGSANEIEAHSLSNPMYEQLRQQILQLP